LFRTEHKPAQKQHKYSINTASDTEHGGNKKRRTLGARRFLAAAQQGYTTLQTRYNSFTFFNYDSPQGIEETNRSLPGSRKSKISWSSDSLLGHRDESEPAGLKEIEDFLVVRQPPRA
jgi:hypothetical protein